MDEKSRNVLAYIVRMVIHAMKTIFLMQNGVCRYYPTCSEYATTALKKHSIPYAVLLIVKRVLWCNPLSHGGYDPVPEKGIKTRE
jgi:uncharacterized protein